MAQRSLWRGAMSFGLIYVPVEMYAATREHGLKMHLLDSRDFAPVGYERINKVTGKTVDWEHVVKGYEYEKEKYVALSEADFKHANVKASETIDIVSFTQAEEVPALYFDTPYFLLPGKGGEKVYALLRDALRAENKVAVASFVMRGREHLCMVTPGVRAMTLFTLRFAQEILEPAEAAAGRDLKPVKIKSTELEMAQKLVSEMTAPFKPEQFHDTYREDLLARIKEKVRKKQWHTLTPEAAEAEKPKAQVIDLMDALRNSIKLRAKHAGRPTAAKKARKRA